MARNKIVITTKLQDLDALISENALAFTPEQMALIPGRIGVAWVIDVWLWHVSVHGTSVEVGSPRQ